MAQNIFQVISETHMDNILKDNMQKLVIVMLSSKMCKPCKIYKPRFVELAGKYPDMFFVYIDIGKFEAKGDKYKWGATPTFSYYFNNILVARIEGVNDGAIVQSLDDIQKKIMLRKQQLMQEKEKEKSIGKESEKVSLGKESVEVKDEKPKFSNPDTELMQKKIFMLNKLSELQSKGEKLTGTYTLDSNYDDLLLEYRYHVDPVFKQYITQQQIIRQQQEQIQILQQQGGQQGDAGLDQELKEKQQKINQIKGLANLEQKMQMASYQKLMQLKKLQQMKEQAEKNQSNL